MKKQSFIAAYIELLWQLEIPKFQTLVATTFQLWNWVSSGFARVYLFIDTKDCIKIHNSWPLFTVKL